MHFFVSGAKAKRTFPRSCCTYSMYACGGGERGANIFTQRKEGLVLVRGRGEHHFESLLDLYVLAFRVADREAVVGCGPEVDKEGHGEEQLDRGSHGDSRISGSRQGVGDSRRRQQTSRQKTVLCW